MPCRRSDRRIAKSTHGGYDGRGQARLSHRDQAAAAWQSLGARPCLVEQRVDIDYEISVLVARRPSGETAVYPPSRNHHTNGILTWAVVPALISEAMTTRAQALAVAIADRIGLVGLLAVECFVTRSGQLLVNELAPRPHNTYHHSERGFATSQFEQLVRAICDLPLGSTALLCAVRHREPARRGLAARGAPGHRQRTAGPGHAPAPVRQGRRAGRDARWGTSPPWAPARRKR